MAMMGVPDHAVSPSPTSTSSARDPANQSFWRRFYPGPAIRTGAAILGGLAMWFGHERKRTAVASAALGAVVLATLAHLGLAVQKKNGFREPDQAFPAAYDALVSLIPDAVRAQSRNFFGNVRSATTDWSPPRNAGATHAEVRTQLNDTRVVRLGPGQSRILHGALHDLTAARFLNQDHGGFDIVPTEDGQAVDVCWGPAVDEGTQVQAELTFVTNEQVDGQTVRTENPLRFFVRRPQIGPLGAHLDLELAIASATGRARALIGELRALPVPTTQRDRDRWTAKVQLAHDYLKEDLAVAIASLDPAHPRRKTMGEYLTNLDHRDGDAAHELLLYLESVTVEQLPRVTVPVAYTPSANHRKDARAVAQKVLQEALPLREEGRHHPQDGDLHRAEAFGARRRAFLTELRDAKVQPFARIAAHLLDQGTPTSESLWELEPLIQAAEVRSKVRAPAATV